MFDNGFPTASKNSVLTFLHCKALNGGSDSIIMILCGSIVTTAGVFSLIPKLLVTEVTLAPIT